MPFELNIIDLSILPPAEGFLSEREQALFKAFKFPKRQTEWAGGRLALKRSVGKVLGITDLKTIEVLPQASGKPDVWVAGAPAGLAHSITHGNGFAAAAADNGVRLLGIDLEKVQPRIAGWAETFFHPSELISTEDEFLTRLWTQKEALVKLLGTGLSVNSFDVRIVNGVPQFYGAALRFYQTLGAPDITLHNLSAPDGFILSAAWAK